MTTRTLFHPALRTGVLLFFVFATFLHASTVTLAKVYEEGMKIDGWLMSEKLDGIRGVWDGRELLSKNGTKIHAPEWFLKAMPPFAVDGELWTRRNDFEHIGSIVLDHTPGEGWKEVGYHVFEAPFIELPFAARIERVKRWLAENPSDFIHLIPQRVCEDKEALQRFLREVESRGGEGVILRDPDSLYESGRSNSYLKVKSFLDAEAKVVGYRPGKGKYEGVVGSLEVELENGTRFFIGSGLSDAQRANPPKIGTIITFKYKELTKNGVPRFACFLRVREDGTWEGR